VLLGSVLLAAGGLVACSSSANSSGSSSQPVEKITIGYAPTASSLAGIIGADKGFFAKYNLKVSNIPSTNGSVTLIPDLLSGQIQFGIISWGSAIPAWAEKIPVVAVAGITSAGPTVGTDTSQFVALKSSGITKPSQLAGQTIALPVLEGNSVVDSDVFLTQHGVNPKTVKFVAIPYPDQQAALASKRVSVVLSVEPSLSEIKQSVPVKVLGGGDYAIAPNLPVTAVLATRSFVQKNSALVKRFQEGLDAVTSYMSANPGVVRSAEVQDLKVPESIANVSILPVYTMKYNMSVLQRFSDLSLQYGAIKTPVKVSNFIVPYPFTPK
jgi:NitT/TauT family transport system substrate-binding protein